MGELSIPVLRVYLKQIFSTTYGISREYWIAAGIAWVIAPIADALIYYSYGRRQASEWVFSSIMTDKIPFTIFVLFLTFVLVFVIAPYRIWRENQKKISALEGEIRCKPAVEIAYSDNGCKQIVGGDRYRFVVEVIPHGGTIRGINVALESCDGMGSFPHINAAFRFKHYPGLQSVTCNPGEKVYVEIMYFQTGVNMLKPKMILQSQEISIPGVGPYIIKLRATGEGATPDYKSFRIGVHNDIPFMKPMTG